MCFYQYAAAVIASKICLYQYFASVIASYICLYQHAAAVIASYLGLYQHAVPVIASYLFLYQYVCAVSAFLLASNLKLILSSPGAEYKYSINPIEKTNNLENSQFYYFRDWSGLASRTIRRIVVRGDISDLVTVRCVVLSLSETSYILSDTSYILSDTSYILTDTP